MKKTQIQLSDHFTYQKLLRFVLPSIVMMVFTSIYGVVDGLFVSNFAGKTPFAAINLVMPFIMVLGGIGFMIGTGGTALVSKVLGEGEPEKAKAVVAELRAMKLKEAAKKVEDGIEETLTYCDFPGEHWTRIRTNNVIERLNREIRRRTRVVGTFPDGNSALMLVCARLRHVAGTQWGCKKYMNMKHLEAALDDTSIAG